MSLTGTIRKFSTHYHKRLISEMIHIKEQKNDINLNNLNLNNDTELLDAYFNILDKLSEL